MVATLTLIAVKGDSRAAMNVVGLRGVPVQLTGIGKKGKVSHQPGIESKTYIRSIAVFQSRSHSSQQ